MRNAKWFIGIVIIVGVLAAVLILNRAQQEGGATNGAGSPQQGASPTGVVYNIGIFEVVRHPVLDSMADSFKTSLEASFPGKVKFETMVPEGDASKTEQMAQRFATEGFDLVFVIGTSQAQSLVKKTKSLPIVLGAATDPEAAGLVESWEKPGGNVTGTSDLSPVEAQLARLLQLLPLAKRIGIVYNPGEDNSAIIVSRFKAQCEKRGLSPITATITNQNEIKQTVVSLKGKVDALYAPTDATLQKAFPLFIKISNEIGIPVFNCDEGTVASGALFSVGFNYADLGRISADMAAKILRKESSPSEMPIRLADSFSLFYNRKQIERFGLEFPASWVEEGKQAEQE